MSPAAGMPGVEPDTTLSSSGLLKVAAKLGLLLSRIGSPITEPRMATAQIVPKPGTRLSRLSSAVRELVERGLSPERMLRFRAAFSKGQYPVC